MRNRRVIGILKAAVLLTPALTALAGIGVTLGGLSMEMIGSVEYEKFYNSPEVAKYVEEDIAQQKNLLNRGLLNEKDYLDMEKKLKKKATQEIFKNDEQFQQLKLQDKISNILFYAGGGTFLTGAIATAIEMMKIYQGGKMEKFFNSTIDDLKNKPKEDLNGKIYL